MVRAREALAGGLLGLALLLSACSGDPAPKIPETQPSASSSAAATRSPEETVRAWVDAQNLALKSGRTEQLAKLGADGCRGCDDFRLPIQQVYRDGGHFETKGWLVRSIHIRPGAGTSSVATVSVTIAGGRTFLRKGSAPISYPTEDRLLEFHVAPQRGQSVVTFVGFRS